MPDGKNTANSIENATTAAIHYPPTPGATVHTASDSLHAALK